MKVLLVNGSPNEKGCTYTALNEISKTLNEEGIETEILNLGKEPIAPCKACRACAGLGRCVVNDSVNDWVDKVAEFDGFVFGSPVHYASISSSIKSFLDRLFFSNSMSGKNSFKHKAGTAIVSARRAGTTAALEQLNKYFQISQMPVISGRYWNMVHGSNPEEVLQDEEGMQNMRILAKNMAWHLKCREIALKTGITPPEAEKIIFTNFIR